VTYKGCLRERIGGESWGGLRRSLSRQEDMMRKRNKLIRGLSTATNVRDKGEGGKEKEGLADALVRMEGIYGLPCETAGTWPGFFAARQGGRV